MQSISDPCFSADYLQISYLKFPLLYIRLSFLDIYFYCHPLFFIVNRRLHQEGTNLGRGRWKENAESFLKLLSSQRPQTDNTSCLIHRRWWEWRNGSFFKTFNIYLRVQSRGYCKGYFKYWYSFSVRKRTLLSFRHNVVNCLEFLTLKDCNPISSEESQSDCNKGKKMIVLSTKKGLKAKNTEEKK